MGTTVEARPAHAGAQGAPRQAQAPAKATERGLLPPEQSSRGPLAEPGGGVRPRISVVIPQQGEGPWGHGRRRVDAQTPTGTPLSCPETGTRPEGSSPYGSRGSPVVGTPSSCPEIPGYMFSPCSDATTPSPQAGTLGAGMGASPSSREECALPAQGGTPRGLAPHHPFEFSPSTLRSASGRPGPGQCGLGGDDGEDPLATTPVLAAPRGWVSPSTASASVYGAGEPGPRMQAPSALRRGRNSGHGRRVQRAAQTHALRPSTPAPGHDKDKAERSPGGNPPSAALATPAAAGQDIGRLQGGVLGQRSGTGNSDLYPHSSEGSEHSHDGGSRPGPRAGAGSQQWRAACASPGRDSGDPGNAGSSPGRRDSSLQDLFGPANRGASKSSSFDSQPGWPLRSHSQHSPQGQPSGPSRPGQDRSPPFQGGGVRQRRRGDSDSGELLRYAVASGNNSPPMLSSSPPLRPGSTTVACSSHSSSGGSVSLPAKGPLTSGDSLGQLSGRVQDARAAASAQPRASSSLSTEVSIASDGIHPGPVPSKAIWRHLVHMDPPSESASPSSPSSPAQPTLPKASRLKLWGGANGQGTPVLSLPSDPSASDTSANLAASIACDATSGLDFPSPPTAGMAGDGPTQHHPRVPTGAASNHSSAARDPEGRGLGPRPLPLGDKPLTQPPRSERAFAAMAALAARRARNACKSSHSGPLRLQVRDEGEGDEAEGSSKGRSKGDSWQPLPECLSQRPKRTNDAPGVLLPVTSSAFGSAAHMDGGASSFQGAQRSDPHRGSPAIGVAPQLQGPLPSEGRADSAQAGGTRDSGVEIFLLDSPPGHDSPTVLSPRSLVRLQGLREKESSRGRSMLQRWQEPEAGSTQAELQGSDAQGSPFLVDATEGRPWKPGTGTGTGTGRVGDREHSSKVGDGIKPQQLVRGEAPDCGPRGKGGDGTSLQQQEREAASGGKPLGVGDVRMWLPPPDATRRHHAVVKPETRPEVRGSRPLLGSDEQQLRALALQHKALEEPRPRGGGEGARPVQGSSTDVGLWGVDEAPSQRGRRGSMGSHQQLQPSLGVPSPTPRKDHKEGCVAGQREPQRPAPALHLHVPFQVSPVPPRAALARSPLGRHSNRQGPAAWRENDALCQEEAGSQAQAHEEESSLGGGLWLGAQAGDATDIVQEKSRQGPGEAVGVEASEGPGKGWEEGQCGDMAEEISGTGRRMEALALPRRAGGRRGPRGLLRGSVGQRRARHGSLGKHQMGVRPQGATTLVLPQDTEWHHGSMEGSPAAQRGGSRSPGGAGVDSPLAAAVAAFAQMSPRGWLPGAPGFEYETALALGCRVGVPLHDHVLRKPYDSLKRRYAIESRKVSWGQFGTIRQCRELATGTLFACKTIHKSHVKSLASAEDIRREVSMLLVLRSTDSVVRLHETVEDKKNIHVVMELCKGGDLHDYVSQRGCLSEPDAALVFLELLQCLGCCHSRRIMHRDVKPENILLTSQKRPYPIRLGDFGVATFFDPSEKQTQFSGTPGYMAPEVFLGQYGPEIDVWSAGAVLYFLLSGVPPFWGSSLKAVRAATLGRDVGFSSPKWQHVSEGCKALIRALLHKDPARRPTIPEAMADPWLQLHLN